MHGCRKFRPDVVRSTVGGCDSPQVGTSLSRNGAAVNGRLVGRGGLIVTCTDRVGGGDQLVIAIDRVLDLLESHHDLFKVHVVAVARPWSPW